MFDDPNDIPFLAFCAVNAAIALYMAGLRVGLIVLPRRTRRKSSFSLDF